MQTQEQNISLIYKKLSDKLSKDDELILNSWLEADYKNQETYHSILQDWKNVANYKTSYKPNKENAWAKISSKISKEKETKVISIQRSKNWYRIVATLLLLVTATFFIKTYFENSNFVTIQTAKNEIRTITLPDGSTVFLNENSSIKYAKLFEQRDVNLKGEAFFNVAKDKEHPFIIHSGETNTQVLGTSFNLNAKDMANIEVTLLSGKVKFSNRKNNSVILNPGEKATYNRHTAIFLMKKIKTENSLAWKTKKLSFDNSNIEDVIIDLQNYYNVEISMDTKNEKCTFTGTFENPKIEEVLDVLSYSLNTDYSIHQGIYTLNTFDCK